MAIVDFTNPKKEILVGNDSVVIRNYIAGIIGGRSLDVTNYPHNLIRAGHVVIRETSTDTYKPMPLTSDGKSYGSLPSGHEYVGVVVATMPAKEACVGIMYAGEVNDIASPFSVESIKAAIKTALPQLVFLHD